MKTSNKILAAFCLIVFSVPVLMLIGFRSQISNQKFTEINSKYGHTETIIKGALNPYKFVKIIGPGRDVFTCNIIPSDSASYDYQNLDEDHRIKIEQINDTLLVKYISPERQVNLNSSSISYTQTHINLYLPVINRIIIDGASVIIDSANTITNPEISFNLSNQAILQLGKFGHSQSTSISASMETESNGLKIDSSAISSNIIERSGKLNNVKIESTNSTFTVGPYSWIKELNLQIKGHSRVNIDNESRIDQLSGFISNSSDVGANWKNIKRLAALAGN